MVKRYGGADRRRRADAHRPPGRGDRHPGPNGAGKTTTIETCEGYRRADGGTVRVLGLDPAADGPRLRPGLASCCQSGGIPQSVPGIEYLSLLSRFHARPLDPRWLLDTVGLARVAKTPLPAAVRRAAAAAVACGGHHRASRAGLP